MSAGVILAGGRSTRFGETDKAIVDLAGTPMIRRVAERLSAVVDSLVVNCRAEQRAAISAALGDRFEVTYAIDDDPDHGPVAGIRDGLGAVDDEYAAVVACDMPLVDLEFVEYLFERAAGVDGAVPRRADGWLQTTQAVYRTAPMEAACSDALDRGERKILAPLDDLEYVVVGSDEIRDHGGVETFRNVNTRADLEAVTALLRATE